MSITENEALLTICDKDYKTLLALLVTHPTKALQELLEELEKARIVPIAEIPDNIVRLHRTVKLLDLDSKIESEFMLVLPYEADIKAQKISILAPMGTALIGLRVSQYYQWTMPKGNKRRFQVLEVSDNIGNNK